MQKKAMRDFKDIQQEIEALTQLIESETNKNLKACMLEELQNLRKRWLATYGLLLSELAS